MLVRQICHILTYIYVQYVAHHEDYFHCSLLSLSPLTFCGPQLQEVVCVVAYLLQYCC